MEEQCIDRTSGPRAPYALLGMALEASASRRGACRGQTDPSRFPLVNLIEVHGKPVKRTLPQTRSRFIPLGQYEFGRELRRQQWHDSYWLPTVAIPL